MEPVTLFSWGYWGWGNATPQLLQAVDAAETGRDFQPPLFVDIRFQRSGRAAGFVGGAFEKLAGPARYRWMKALGNRSIATRSGPRIQIHEPAAADELLDHALEAQRHGQRVLFFCACKFPRWEGVTSCHRDTVADLVLGAAQRRGVPARVVEWPGGDPTSIRLEVSRAVWKAIQGGRTTIPLEEPARLGDYAALPWASVVSIEWEGNRDPAFVGPARYEGRWVLPIVEGIAPGTDQKAIEDRGKELRAFLGVERRSV